MHQTPRERQFSFPQSVIVTCEPLPWPQKVSQVPEPRLLCYTDADFCGDPATYKSTSGYICILECEHANYVLDWFSRKQTAVSRSTTEAELCAAGHGATGDHLSLKIRPFATPNCQTSLQKNALATLNQSDAPLHSSILDGLSGSKK